MSASGRPAVPVGEHLDRSRIGIQIRQADLRRVDDVIARPPRRRWEHEAQARATTDRSGEDTRAAIIATAQRLFGRAGYHGVSLQAIADSCDLDGRALYHHFPSKRVLFDAAAVDALDRMGREVLSQVFSQTGSTHRVDSYIEVFRRVHANDPELLGFMGMLLVDYRSTGGGEDSLLQVTAETAQT